MAAAALVNTATTTLTLSLSESVSPVAGYTAASKVVYSNTVNLNLQNGAGGTAGNTDQYYAETTNSIAAAGTATINLQSLTDNTGRTISFARVLQILFFIPSGTLDQKLEVYQAATDPWAGGPFPATTPGIPVNVGGTVAFLLGQTEVVGYPVTATSNSLTISNPGANPITYTMVVIGTFE